MTTPRCFRCQREPGDIPEYVDAAEAEHWTADAIARSDGTFNAATNHFCCTDCYIALGMPTAPNGWKAP